MQPPGGQVSNCCIAFATRRCQSREMDSVGLWYIKYSQTSPHRICTMLLHYIHTHTHIHTIQDPSLWSYKVQLALTLLLSDCEPRMYWTRRLLPCCRHCMNKTHRHFCIHRSRHYCRCCCYCHCSSVVSQLMSSLCSHGYDCYRCFHCRRRHSL